MKAELLKLKKEVCQIRKPKNYPQKKKLDFIKNTQVALMAGGESSRFREVMEADNVNKNAFKLPNGETMIERAVLMYKKAGITDFVALVYHKAESIVESLGDGSKLGVNIKYSYDPQKPVGKGGAIRNALDNGSIDQSKNLIVHNPDDVIVNFEDKFADLIVRGHLEALEQGKCATVVVVEETPYSFTGMEILNNSVENIEMYPLIPIPTHMGVTIFSPDVYHFFRELFDLEKKSDFEQVLFPILAEQKSLYAVSIPNNAWIAVNNLKSYKSFVEYLKNRGA